MSEVRLEQSPEPTPGTLEQIFSLEAEASGLPFDRGEDEQRDSEKLHKYLVDLFADRVCGGDYVKAAQMVDVQVVCLRGQSPREVAKTDAGILRIRSMLSKDMLDKGAWQPYYRSIAGYVQSRFLDEGRKSRLLIDLLPLAWDLTHEEFSLLLKVPSDRLEQYRTGWSCLDDEIDQGISRLRSLYETMREVILPSEFAAAWHRSWPKGSVIGERSAWQAFLEDGHEVLDHMENFFLSAGVAAQELAARGK